MKQWVQRFEVRDPASGREVYCPDHPQEPMHYDVPRDLYRCTGAEGLCGRNIKAQVIEEVLGGSA